MRTYRLFLGPGAITAPISWADPRTGSVADASGGSDGGAVESTEVPDVGEAELDASGAGNAGVITGVGLVADPQAPRSSDTAITAAIAEREEITRGSPVGV